MEFTVKNLDGKDVTKTTLPDDIFGVEVNVGLMHQAYVRQMANGRQGTAKAKTRSEVIRTKAKWYRQKGTGRARHGSRNAPIFVGGGVAHGPKLRKYTKDMPKKMRREALRSALSALVNDDQLVVVDSLELADGKTKTMQGILYNLVGESSAIILLADSNPNVERGVRNMSDAMYLRANYLNIRDLLKYEKVIMPLDALELINNWLGKSAN